MAGIAALAVAYVFSQFYRSFLAVLTPALTAELGATSADLSMASGAWFAAFALMQFIVGVSLDRFGPRRTAAVLLGVAGGGGAFIFAAATQPWMITLGMVLIGIGCSPVLMASFFVFARTFRPARFAVLASWFMAIGMAGNVIGSSPLAIAAEALGWRAVMGGLGALTVLSALAVQALLRDPPQTEADRAENTGFKGYLELIRMPVLWPIIPLVAVHYAPSAGIRGLWTGPYLADVHGAGTLLIGDVTLWMALSMVAGSFLYGPLDTLLKTRKWVIFGGTGRGLAAMAVRALSPEIALTPATVLLIVIGVSGAGYGVAMAHARAFFPAQLTGRGVTMMNFFSIGGVGLMQFLTGAVVSSREAAGPVEAYGALFGFYAVVVASALAIYLFARDARPE